MVASQLAKGTQIRFSSDSGATWSALIKLHDITGPDRTVSFIDDTTHDSTDGYEEMIPVFKSAGKVTFGMSWLPSQPVQQLMVTNFEALQLLDWEIIIPTTSPVTIAGQGYIDKIGASMPVKERLTSDVSIQTTGKWE